MTFGIGIGIAIGIGNFNNPKGQSSDDCDSDPEHIKANQRISISLRVRHKAHAMLDLAPSPGLNHNVMRGLRFRQWPVNRHEKNARRTRSCLAQYASGSFFVHAHEAKAIHYLTATGMRLALLLNFGTPRLGIKRIII
jgi:hypothetical protein